jgi:hypothetical protein
MTTKLKPGYYETDYGNTAHYTGGKTAKDLDMGERVPVEFLRPETWKPAPKKLGW